MQAPIYSASEEMELMARLWSPSLKDDPLAFVLYTFPWGQAGTPLEHFPGPRKWQRQILADLRDHIKENNGKIDFSTARMAIASGRGIGKSALVSWLTIWMLSSRIGSTTIVSANSEAQLRSVTWAEITKWLAMSPEQSLVRDSSHTDHASQMANRTGRTRPKERHALLVS
jgi:phage terminase large subunit-like protein